MTENQAHRARVSDWLERSVRGTDPEGAVQAFARAFAAVWDRARVTLGDVTLGAIGDRVVSNAAEKFPALACLSLGSGGLDCQELEQRAHAMPRDELEQALWFALVEFLTVLGNLTADVMTPALHAALMAAASGSAVQATPNPEDEIDSNRVKSE